MTRANRNFLCSCVHVLWSECCITNMFAYQLYGWAIRAHYKLYRYTSDALLGIRIARYDMSISTHYSYILSFHGDPVVACNIKYSEESFGVGQSSLSLALVLALNSYSH